PPPPLPTTFGPCQHSAIGLHDPLQNRSSALAHTHMLLVHAVPGNSRQSSVPSQEISTPSIGKHVLAPSPASTRPRRPSQPPRIEVLLTACRTAIGCSFIAPSERRIDISISAGKT